MQAINIKWDIDIDDVMHALDEMSNRKASEILLCPYKEWTNMAYQDQRKYVEYALQNEQSILNNIMELPDSVVIPKFVYESCSDVYDEVSDWLSDEYGFCHAGFELVKSKKIWFRAGMEIELSDDQYNKLLELHETRNHAELERFVEWMVRNGTMSGETYIPEYENGLDGTDYDNPDKEISVLM